MKARVVWAIARKDILETFSARGAWGPALLAPLAELIGLPLYAHLLGNVRDPAAFADFPPELIAELTRHVPPALASTLHALPPGPVIAILISGHLAAPAFVLPPMMVAVLAGSTAFVGEKERRTLEALLYTPATDAELLAGKSLAAVGPALLLSWITFGLYVLVENAATWSFMARWWFPTPVWWPWIFWVGPGALVLATVGTVAISARVRTQVAASQLGGLLGTACSLLVMGQVFGLLSTGPATAWGVGAGLWLLDLGLLAFAVRTFSRGRLIRRL